MSAFACFSYIILKLTERASNTECYYVCKKINLVYTKFSKMSKGMHLVNDVQW